MEAQSLFWGVILKPDKRYEQVVEETFHISKACLEPSTYEQGKVTTVYLEKDADEFIICNLQSFSENLDLNFNVGEKICFRVEGSATVHLTGYLAELDDDFMGEDDSMEMGDSVLMEEESDEEEEESSPPQLVGKRKRVNGVSPAGEKLAKKGKTDKSALDKLVEEAKKSKELRQAQSARASLLSVEKKKAASQKDEDMDDDESADEEDDDDDIEDSDQEEEEEDSDEVEEEEEEEFPKKSPAPNKKAKGQTPAKNGTPTPKKPANKDTDTPKSEKRKEGAAASPEKTNGVKEGQKTPKRTLKGGLVVEDLKLGNGPVAEAGKFVGMYYEGTLKAGGKVFDSCMQGKPFKFKLGKGEVIKGWDVGLVGIKVGGKRRLTIPPKMAYGSEGASPDIPPNAVLSFEVECKSVN